MVRGRCSGEREVGELELATHVLTTFYSGKGSSAMAGREGRMCQGRRSAYVMFLPAALDAIGRCGGAHRTASSLHIESARPLGDLGPNVAESVFLPSKHNPFQYFLMHT